eukprot:16431701-Heterocapsa_arctica.AAC.1
MSRSRGGECRPGRAVLVGIFPEPTCARGLISRMWLSVNDILGASVGGGHAKAHSLDESSSNTSLSGPKPLEPKVDDRR